jgi:hypothetical protein
MPKAMGCVMISRDDSRLHSTFLTGWRHAKRPRPDIHFDLIDGRRQLIILGLAFARVLN